MISSRNISLYCEQLATLTEAGVPLNHALTTLSRSATTRGLRRISADVRTRINSGETFAGALSAHTGRLPPLLVNFLEVGERSGRLDRVARSLSKYYKGQWELSRETIMQLLPTLFYFSMCYAVIVFIQYVTSSWNTASLLHSAQSAGFVVACAVLAFLAIKVLSPVRAAIVLVASCLPFVSGIMRQHAISRFTLAMEASLAAGLDVKRAIHLSANAMANPIFAPRVRRAAKGIDQGLTITQALERTHVFGRGTVGLFEAGELSGRIVETMGHVAESSRFRATTAARAAARMFTISVYVAMILYVALKVISLYWESISGLGDIIESVGE